MHAEELKRLLNPAAFRPLRLTMNGGRTFDVGHPEMIQVGYSIAFVFRHNPKGIVEDWEMISLDLIETVKQLETPAPVQGNGQGIAP